MGRWEPDARGRLAKAAMELYAEHGFEQTTVAEIAARAGLTERTFFRHFADKREVLFYGMEWLRDLLARAVADAPASATAMDAVGAAFEAAAAMLQENPERVRLRDAIVSANAELRERELIKLAALAVSGGRRAPRPRCPRAGREPGRRDGGRRLQGRLRTLGQRARPAGPARHLPRVDGGTEGRTGVGQPIRPGRHAGGSGAGGMMASRIVRAEWSESMSSRGWCR